MGKVGFRILVGLAAVTCTVAAVMVGKRLKNRRKWTRAVGLLMELEEACRTPVTRLRQVLDAMAVEMHAGLASEGGSKLRMLLTFVDSLPTGSEMGIHYALHLGGTNFRVLRVHLIGRRSNILRHEIELKPIPQHLLTGTSEDLFEFIASSLKQFVENEDENDLETLALPSRKLGFTFSFPVRQKSLTSGFSLKWTKAFSISNMVEKDVCELLQQAMTRVGLDMRVAALVNKKMFFLLLLIHMRYVTMKMALSSSCYIGIGKIIVNYLLQTKLMKILHIIKCYLPSLCDDSQTSNLVNNLKYIRYMVSSYFKQVNDTVGTLVVGHYNDEDTVAAVIIGTGTNACYLERADAIIKCQGFLTASGTMVVNMEWGNFWSSHLPITQYDIELDSESRNPNDQGFEKMISGMYLGDIVRRVLSRMSQESDVFGPASLLSRPFTLGTQLMAAMHEDNTPELSKVARILKDELGIPDVSLKVRKLIVNVCDVISRRAARLAAAGIVGILKKMGRDGSGSRVKGPSGSNNMKRSVVAIEGGLYTGYGMFREYLNEAVAEILGEEYAPYVILKVIEDGSGMGAALVAASQSSDVVEGRSGE